MSKEICFIVTDALSFNVLYKGQLEFLAGRGHRLTLICGGSAAELAKLRARNVGTVIDVGMERRPNLWADIRSLARLRRHLATKRFDAFVVTTPKALLLGSLAGWLSRQPRRIALFQGRVYENFSGMRRRIYALFDRLSLWAAHEALFVSHSLQAAYSGDFPAAARKGRVLGAGSGNGIDTDAFSPAAIAPDRREAVRKALGLTGGEFVVVTIGRICRDKGIAEIAEVVGKVRAVAPEVRFVLVGPVEDPESGATLARLEQGGGVVHLDFTDDVAPYFALANTHLFLSHREGFGNVAIEAAAMGCPTLAFDVVGLKDSVAEGVSGDRFPFADTAAVAARLLAFAADPAACQARFSGARDWAVTQYSQPDVWHRYETYYGGPPSARTDT